MSDEKKDNQQSAKQVTLLEKQHPVDRFMRTLRQRPSEELIKRYHADLKKINVSKKSNHVTPTERAYIHGRKIWNDIVSITNERNKKIIIKDNIKAKVIEKIQKLKVENPEIVYEQCLDYLQNHTVLVVSFSLDILPKTLTSYQLLNIWEIGARRNSWLEAADEPYGKHRESIESKHFDYLPNQFKHEFIFNKQARPRYGAFYLLDQNDVIHPTRSYGQSFIVLKDIIKLNALFVPGDSFNLRYSDVCTVNYLELLLYQCPYETFEAILMRATGNQFHPLFDQNIPEDTGGYLEVMLPAINLLDPNCIEHIHLYKNPTRGEEIDANELLHIRKFGLSVSYQFENPYIELNRKFSDYIKEHDYEQLNTMASKHPSLLKLTDKFDASFIERLWSSRKNTFQLYNFVSKLQASNKITVMKQIAASSNAQLKSAFLKGVDIGDHLIKYFKENAKEIQMLFAKQNNNTNEPWIFWAAENNHWQFVLNNLKFCNLNILNIEKLKKLAAQKNVLDKIRYKLEFYEAKSITEADIIIAAEQSQWDFVMTSLRFNSVNINILILLELAEKNNAGAKISIYLCAFASRDELLLYVKELVLSFKGSKQEQYKLSAILLNHIRDSLDPHNLVEFLNQIYAIKMSDPFLLEEQLGKNIGRDDFELYSEFWKKIIKTAKDKILNVAASLPDSIKSDDTDIINFLKLSTDVLSSRDESREFKLYKLIRDHYLENEACVFQINNLRMS